MQGGGQNGVAQEEVPVNEPVGNSEQLSSSEIPNNQPVAEGDAPGQSGVQKLADRILDRTEEKRRIPLRERARELEAQVGVKANIIESLDEVKNREARERIAAGEPVAGWYSGGQVYLYMPNIKARREIELTYVHEVVAHHGVKKLLGERFNEFLDGVWNMMSEADRARMLAYVGVKENPTLQDMRAAADEYVAELAEKMNLGELEQSTWEKIVDWLKELLENIGFENLTKEDIESMLKASYSNLRAESGKGKTGSTENDFRARMTFHGSGAQFDRFDHAFMGTGEGAQAFGWGTYVTEVEGIGRTYAEGTSGNIFKSGFGDFYLKKIREGLAEGKSFEEIKQDLLEFHAHLYEQVDGNTEMYGEFISDYEKLQSLKEEDLPKRNLYSVEIPDDNGSNYLHWEERINGEIQERVANGLQNIGFEIEPDMNHLAYSRDGKIAVLNINAKGKDLYAELSEALGGDKAASLFLNNLGFVGISYPANATTGGRADGARNYVIFNENDAQIKDRTMFRVSRTPQEFDATQAEAVEKRGIVAPGLNEVVVNVVDVPRHDFTGNLKEARAKAKEWAIENYTGKEFDLPENAGKYVISKNAIGKYLDKSAFDKSENAAVHLSVLKELPNVISNSIEAEIHADYSKGVNGERSAENGVNRNDLLVHRIYGAVNIDGKTYRVKTTIHEFRDANTANTPHSYEVTKIELIEDSTVTPNDGINNPLNRSVNSISATKLLEGVEKSYDKGKKVLDESENSSENPQDAESGIRFRTRPMTKEEARQMVRELIVPFAKELREEQETRFRTIGGNSGYVGYSMSKRAAEAREEGRYPKTDFKKEYGVSGKSFDLLQKAGIIYNSEWHHTSKFGNRTDFYSWDEPEFAEYYAANKKRIDKAINEVEKLKPEYNELKAIDKYLSEGRSQSEVRDLVDEDLRRIEPVEKAYNDARSKLIEQLKDEFYDLPEDSGTRFRIANEKQDIFVSNAQRAVEGIQQNKATAEQWIAMLKKNGGLKAGEDAWLGLEEWLNERGKVKGENGKVDPSAEDGSSPKTGAQSTVTKQEILDYIAQNRIQIEEVQYGESVEGISEETVSESEEFGNLAGSLIEYDEEGYPYVDRERFEQLRNEDEDFLDGFSIDYWGEGIEVNDPEAAARYLGLAEGSKLINSTRLNYTTDGLDNKREIALVVPTVESWNASDEIHFGDAGEGRAVAWVRFGETTAPVKEYADFYAFQKQMQEKYYPERRVQSLNDADLIKLSIEEIREFERLRKAKEQIPFNQSKERVLVIDEIQSKRHQEGREKGYRGVGLAKEVFAAEEEVRKTNRELTAYREPLKEKYNFKELGGSMFERLKNFDAMLSEEERITMDALGKARNEAEKRLQELREQESGIPSAPFEKNWHELAMKRMLRLAAEEGFDKVAWTTGEQQAERYNLSKQVGGIEVRRDNGERHVITYDPQGNPIWDATGVMTPEEITETFGKELGGKILAVESGKRETITGDNLSFGGEGMKGFYDRMLPSFVQKYTKKWGAKVGEVTMPSLEENNTMWSVDVTPEMQESVMQGQTMFRMGKKETAPETASVQDEHQPTVVSSADGAKVLKDLDNAIKEYENKSSHPKTLLGDVAKVLNAKKHGSNSQYATFEAMNGKVFTIRLANHNATVSTFDNHDESEGISIVVTAQDNNGITNDGNAHLVEFFYDAIKLRKADGKPLVEILKSIKQALYSGEYKDNTGLAEVQEVNSSNTQGEDIRFRITDTDRQALEFKRQHKGSANIVAIDTDALVAELLAQGFTAEEIPEIREMHEKGVLGFYDRKRNTIYLLGKDHGEKENNATFWHENTHKAIGELDVPQEIMDEFYAMPNKRFIEFFEKKAEEFYEPEEYAEELIAYFVEEAKKDGDNFDDAAKTMETSAENMERLKEIVEPIINYINHGRRVNEGAEGNDRTVVRETIGNGDVETLSEGARTETGAGTGETRFSTREESIDNVSTQPLTLMERITNSLLEASAKNKENLELRASALRTFGRDINRVLSLMKAQREYDKSTVDTLVKLAKMYFQNAQLLGEVTPYEVARIMGVLNRSVGKRDISTEAAKLMDILLDAKCYILLILLSFPTFSLSSQKCRLFK